MPPIMRRARVVALPILLIATALTAVPAAQPAAPGPLRRGHPRRPRARRHGQSVDPRRRRHRGRPLRARSARSTGTGARRDRRARPLRLARLDRHDGPVGRRAAAERPGREQAAHGRDDRRSAARAARRCRPSGVADYFAGLERSGISINFGSYYSETQARTAVLGNTARGADARRARAHAGDARRRRCAAARWA